MMAAQKIAFVTGANGITGSAIIEYLVKNTNAEQFAKIITSSRSPSQLAVTDPRVEFIALDFTQSPQALAELMRETCSEVTHAYFSSYVHKDDFVELNKSNASLFENFLEAITQTSHKLQNVTLQTGGKYYNVHLGPVPSPAREEDPRAGSSADNFYYPQEDFLAAKQKGSSWTWNVIRPQAIIGTSPKANGMNSALTYAMYILTCKKLGEEPLMPTNQIYWDGYDDLSYAPLIADLTIYASTESHCANQAFNLTNGDHISWRYMWPRLTGYFGVSTSSHRDFVKPGMKVGAPFLENSLTEWATPEKQDAWNRLCDESGCPEAKASWYAGTWQYQDWVFGRTWSATLNNSKRNKFGYKGYMDTYDSLIETFEKMRALKQLPA